MTDVDFGDMLDYLAGGCAKPCHPALLESVTNAPKFMSAARRAARSKPVIVGSGTAARAAPRRRSSHTGALAGADGAYEAAFRRAGIFVSASWTSCSAPRKSLRGIHRSPGRGSRS
jgi:acetyltransferase